MCLVVAAAGQAYVVHPNSKIPTARKTQYGNGIDSHTIKAMVNQHIQTYSWEVLEMIGFTLQYGLAAWYSSMV